MKKFSLLLSIAVISSASIAHQMVSEFKDKSWNWNNGSHGASVVSAITVEVVDGVRAITPELISHEHTADGKVVINEPKVIAIDKTPIFDNGIRPSNSK